MAEHKVEVLEGAKTDIREAHDWYEEQSEGLGGKFEDAVDKTISEITENPEHHAVRDNGRRAALAKPFPYIIYYVFVAPFVRIIQVFHTSQDPAKRR